MAKENLAVWLRYSSDGFAVQGLLYLSEDRDHKHTVPTVIVPYFLGGEDERYERHVYSFSQERVIDHLHSHNQFFRYKPSE